MTGKNDDIAHAREDSLLAEPIPRATEHLAERHAGDFDAETGPARFETRLAKHTRDPAASAEGRAGAGYAWPTVTAWIKRFQIWLADVQHAIRVSALRRRESSIEKNASHEIGGWQAVPSGMLPAPERGAVLQHVRQLAESRDGAIDEGAGASLDPLIESWVGGWIATVEADYADHCAAISVRRGRARQWLTESTHIAEHETEALGRISAAYSTCLASLTGEQADRAIGGRSSAELAPSVLLGLAGVLTVIVAFRATLALALPSLSGILAWLTAAGATSLALVAAASAGISLAVRRQAGHIGSWFATALAALAWTFLGLATVLIPLLATGAHSKPLAALFFGAIYLTSGACTVFLAEKLYDPRYFVFRRLQKHYNAQAKFEAKAQASKDQAEAALEVFEAELQREDQRRVAAIAGCKAMGAEAASYARILTAARLRDPAKASLTKTGPGPGPIQQPL
jgi:hypothetical protein